MLMEKSISDELGHNFRQFMRHMAASVCIVSTAHNGEKVGMTVSSAVSLSFDPMSILVCIHQNSNFHKIVSERDSFSVNLLHEDQAHISDKFSRPGSEDNLFSNGDWDMHAGEPYLKDAQGTLFLSIKDRHDYGTHTIIIGEVMGVKYRSDAMPLVYLNGSYQRWNT